MFGKRTRGYDESEVPPARRFRSNIGDLFLGNEVSAQRARDLIEDARLAGAAGVADLAAAGSGGRHPGNTHRDLLRAFLKNKGWPPPYQAPVTVFDPRQQGLVTKVLPMWLPHELVWAFARRGDAAKLTERAGLSFDAKAHMEKVAEELACDNLVCLGVWGDAVPFNWDRSQSVTMLTLSLPGVMGFDTMRLPLFAINTKFKAKGRTLDEVFGVLKWSFEMLAVGLMPLARHDGGQWLASDARRRRWAGSPIGAQGAIAQVSGDWAFYKEAFKFPQFNQSDGCCWRCRIVPADLRNVGASASWREQRLSHWDLVLRMRQRGEDPSPLMGCPGVRSTCFVLDWLHIMDLGRPCAHKQCKHYAQPLLQEDSGWESTHTMDLGRTQTMHT